MALFFYKPSILGYPDDWKSPYVYIHDMDTYPASQVQAEVVKVKMEKRAVDAEQETPREPNGTTVDWPSKCQNGDVS